MFNFLEKLFIKKKENYDDIDANIIIEESSDEYIRKYEMAKRWRKKVRTCPDCGFYSEDYNPEEGMIIYGGAHDYKPCICPKCGCHYKYEINHIYRAILFEEEQMKEIRRKMGMID